MAVPAATAQAGVFPLSPFSANTPKHFVALVSDLDPPAEAKSHGGADDGLLPTCCDADTTKDSSAPPADTTGAVQPIEQKTRLTQPADFNLGIYYKNRLEFSQDLGVFPINIPFPFDFMMRASYGTYPLKYTLVPVISSLRWQIDNLHGPLFLRGNWELDVSGAVVWIPSGPETRYFAYLMGMRRNFVPHNWKNTPYFDWRIGLGDINAKGPLGVAYAQGQNFTFTLNMGAGVRHNFSPRYGMTFGLNWMHISNGNLSEGSAPNWGVRNYGINVVGPIFGIDVRLRSHPEPF